MLPQAASRGLTDMTLIPSSPARKRVGFRWFQVALLVVVAVAAVAHPRPASAWCGRWQGGGFGWYRPACFRPFAYRPFCPPVYGYGFTNYRTFSYCSSYGSPGFFSGWSYPYAYGCNWYSYNPMIYTPYYNCYPSAFAPVYGPAGVLPFMGFGAAASPAASVQSIAARQPSARPALVAAAPRATALATSLRSSNAQARLRAGRLMAVGDRHLRSAVDDPARLARALDSYRRAATIAPDLPDNHLRQAIVLTALDRQDDAAAAIQRAIAIDGRLGDDPRAAVAAAGRLPPVPALAAAPASTALAARSESLIGRIFRDEATGDEPAANWIADRWSRQWQAEIARVARK
jgi:tetratricopeptide (TPR) repeat protein